jgi:hypothetical protein
MRLVLAKAAQRGLRPNATPNCWGGTGDSIDRRRSVDYGAGYFIELIVGNGYIVIVALPRSSSRRGSRVRPARTIAPDRRQVKDGIRGRG